MLIELSIVAGNDFTKQFVRPERNCTNFLGMRFPILLKCVDWVLKYKRVENCPIFSAEMVGIMLLEF